MEDLGSVPSISFVLVILSLVLKQSNVSEMFQISQAVLYGQRQICVQCWLFPSTSNKTAVRQSCGQLRKQALRFCR